MRSDSELKASVQAYWEIQFMNYGGDDVFEGPANNNADEYDRILELLEDAEIHIIWPSDDMPEVFRVVNEDGSFAKPVSVGYKAKPGQTAWSSAKGLYMTLARAQAAIRGGIGKFVEKGKIVKWERID